MEQGAEEDKGWKVRDPFDYPESRLKSSRSAGSLPHAAKGDGGFVRFLSKHVDPP